MANNVFKFPGGQIAREDHNPPAAASSATKENTAPSTSRKLVDSVVTALWFVVVFCWPFLRWILGLDVAFRFALMCWHWDNNLSHAGWTFLLHFGVLVALTVFVSAFKPQSFK
ncbi:KleE stable inheritance protein [Pseudomonas syringae]|uniref:KleE stable inheritance protein n=1 Tax=Pseudomonas syringae TaxID=317 RepID=UPI0002098DF3|nr:KleE stable inheritance protein [Pseudomonas syringae]MDP5168575.1 KleE stable inheritance protein [Pseudomonas syringae pv. aptata str. DSM 50252]